MNHRNLNTKDKIRFMKARFVESRRPKTLLEFEELIADFDARVARLRSRGITMDQIAEQSMVT